jgi:DNA repair protein RadC
LAGDETAREALIEYQPRIREMPYEERPRERLRAVGAGPLTNAELLAILLRTGGNGENVVRLGERLIARFGGIGGLARASSAQLCDVKGIGEAKAAQVLAGIELGRRIVSAAPEERTVVRCSDDVARFCRASMIDLEQEEVRLLLLDTRNRVTRVHTAYQGNAHTAVVRVSELFREAVRENAIAVAVVHNHPSGDPSPSPQDVALTAQIVEAGELLGIDVLDHVVIARGGHVSLRQRGLWPEEEATRAPRAAGSRPDELNKRTKRTSGQRNRVFDGVSGSVVRSPRP